MPKLILASLAFLWSLETAATVDLGEAEIRAKAEAFIEAKNARQQPDTTVEDIDRFLALIADEFVDEHLKFNVTETSKEGLRTGMINKLKDKVLYSKITIDQMMIGSNVAFVKYTESAKVRPAHLDREIEYTATNIISLEFDDSGLIKHIRRHHGL